MSYFDKINKNSENKKIESKKDFISFRKQVLPKFKSKVQNLKKDFNADSNSIFVGEYNYPNVNVGILSSENYNFNDDTKHWVKNNFTISKIVEKRFDLLNSRKVSNVAQTFDLNSQQEIALSKKPVNVEVNLNKITSNKMSYDKYIKPMGPSGDLKKLKLTQNSKIPTKVEKIVSENNLKSAKGLNILYKKGFNNEYLTQVLTSGSLGIKSDRILVPTKWGITAVDDIIGKDLIKNILDFKKTGNLVYTGSYLGNYFIILFFDGIFSYELFEFFKKSSDFTTDYENWKGRKKYANETSGGYYAARMSVLEKLKNIKRQSKVLVLRFITDEYYMPLGVWVVREAVKITLSNKPIEFGSEELMLNYVKHFSKKKFGRDLSWLKNKSRILQEKKQKTILDF